MQVTANEVDSCVFNVHYVSDAAEVLNKKGEVMERFRQAPVPGNRKGKASPQAIAHHYKNQIDASLKNALTEAAIHNTIFEKKLRAHGPAKLISANLLGLSFDCEFEIRTKPEFTLPEYKGISVPLPHIPDSVSSISEAMLQGLRVKHGEQVPYTETDFIQDSDSVILNYKGSLDGELVPQLCAEGEMLTVGASQAKEFDESILGMKAGEEREFDILVADSALPSIAGKRIHFWVQCLTGSKHVLGFQETSGNEQKCYFKRSFGSACGSYGY